MLVDIITAIFFNACNEFGYIEKARVISNSVLITILLFFY